MTDEDKPKIIIDEDWKSQVQAEKEALARQATTASGQPQERQRSGPLPPASLVQLMTMLATQATISLGAVANPLTGKMEPDLEAARHMIDLLQVLEDKTQGNRTAQESALLSQLLDELRLGFLRVQQAAQASGSAAAQ
jgi:hypothetical protein